MRIEIQSKHVYPPPGDSQRRTDRALRGWHYLWGQGDSFAELVCFHHSVDSVITYTGKRKVWPDGALATVFPHLTMTRSIKLSTLFCHAQPNTLMTCSVLLLSQEPRRVSDIDTVRKQSWPQSTHKEEKGKEVKRNFPVGGVFVEEKYHFIPKHWHMPQR